MSAALVAVSPAPWNGTSTAALAASLAAALGVAPASRLVLAAAAPAPPGPDTLSVSVSVSGFGGNADAAQAALDALSLLHANVSASPLPAAAAAACGCASLSVPAPPSLSARVAVVVTVPPSANLSATAAALQAVADAPASLLPGLASCAAAANMSASSGVASQPTVITPPRGAEGLQSALSTFAATPGALPAATAILAGALGLLACCCAFFCVVIRRRRQGRVAAALAARARRASETHGKAAAAGAQLTRAEAMLALSCGEAARGGGDAAFVRPLPPKGAPPPPARPVGLFGSELAKLERAVAWGEASAAAAQDAVLEAASRVADMALRRLGSRRLASAVGSDGAAPRADGAWGEGAAPGRRVSEAAGAPPPAEPRPRRASEAARAFAGGGVNPLWAEPRSAGGAAPTPAPGFDVRDNPLRRGPAPRASPAFIESSAPDDEAAAPGRARRASATTAEDVAALLRAAAVAGRAGDAAGGGDLQPRLPRRTVAIATLVTECDGGAAPPPRAVALAVSGETPRSVGGPPRKPRSSMLRDDDTPGSRRSPRAIQQW